MDRRAFLTTSAAFTGASMFFGWQDAVSASTLPNVPGSSTGWRMRVTTFDAPRRWTRHGYRHSVFGQRAPMGLASADWAALPLELLAAEYEDRGIEGESAACGAEEAPGRLAQLGCTNSRISSIDPFVNLDDLHHMMFALIAPEAVPVTARWRINESRRLDLLSRLAQSVPRSSGDAEGRQFDRHSRRFGVSAAVGPMIGRSELILGEGPDGQVLVTAIGPASLWSGRDALHRTVAFA